MSRNEETESRCGSELRKWTEDIDAEWCLDGGRGGGGETESLGLRAGVVGPLLTGSMRGSIEAIGGDKEGEAWVEYCALSSLQEGGERGESEGNPRVEWTTSTDEGSMKLVTAVTNES